jgi:hypothetical protein
MPLRVPKYRDLPIKADAPPGSAWGVFDKDGKRDVYGTLNFITPEAVVAAKEEIRVGESAILTYPPPAPFLHSSAVVITREQADDWHVIDDSLPFHLPYVPCGNDIRKESEHKVLAMNWGMYVLDDEVSFNTQSSSQWDGLCARPCQLHMSHS